MARVFAAAGATRLWRRGLVGMGALSALSTLAAGPVQAQQAGTPTQLPKVIVTAPAAYGVQADYKADTASIGPLGTQAIQDAPQSVTVVPEDVLVNQQLKTVNDTLHYLPSVEIRNQQGFEVSRPQSRGFQGTVVQNTRLDGLNVIGTTAIPAENLSGIQVLNGLAGSLFGPETPAGVFNYILKRPTDTPLLRAVEGFDSQGVFTEELDAGGRVGATGYRLNLVHGEGQDYAPGSNVDRSLVSAAFDLHLDDRTVVEIDASHYEEHITGLPGSIVYFSGKSTFLPPPIDPTRLGFGQPGAGTDLLTDTGLIKVKHIINDDWNFEVGGLYQDAVRNLFGITNTLTDDAGNFTVTKNFNAVPHFTIFSDLAYLNGHVDVFGMTNDLTLGTNGFINGQYSYRNSIATVLGSANLANPLVFATKPTPTNGGQFESALVSEQSFIGADTIHLNAQWAVQGVISSSLIQSQSYAANGAVTSQDSRDGVLSPTVSVIYKPFANLTAHATFATSVEEGEQAPAGTANVNQFLAPYHDREYEIGAKYTFNDSLLISLDGFRITRPLANTSPVTNLFGVVGTQKNYGVELFAQGSVRPDLSVFGGVTYIDARLQGTGNAATNDKYVVGVPRFKTDVLLDYHPDFGRGFAFTGAVHSESARAATNTNNSFSPSYATLDLGVRYSTGVWSHPLTARFQVINVTDTRYYVAIADGNIVGSPGANTAYSGTPRTYEASLEMDF
ncbi:MAG TPA: TonB-dependent siderophore receptor [Stellaceae bacterium]|nr:TonB-dependent siderophore receptor [Stellaceae bacterium]